MGFWDFWNQHPLLAWCALWLGWPAAWFAVVVVNTIFRIINRLFRTINVCVRGWPPEHLDADGDWKPVEEAKL